MKKLEFSKTLFLRSVVKSEDYPVLHKGKEKVPEVALVGRSNVGKSSLINHLTQLKALAKTSSVPGKTQTINFYLTDNNLCLVDLPGYGFSKVSHTVKHTWSESLENYLKNREELKLILLLIDFRRNLSEEDKDFIEWASSEQKELFFIFTKADKLSGEEKKRALEDLLLEISGIYSHKAFEYITYSVKEMDCRIKLREKLQQITN
ncbi:MAG: YihA family ribosome biogenesis GTP-binding protein [Chlamydiae bacterium]|nr:YihA family ribosome biogenesis GTP-binding protein [Chlamydiota bacterium]